jgi:hypothetical protein
MRPAIDARAGAHRDRVAEREAPARFGVGRPGSARGAGGVAGAPLMFNLPPSVRLFIAAQLVDGRKGPDSLMTLVRDVLGQDIFDGHLFVFFTRRRDRVRIPAPGESRLAANSFEQSNVGQILRSTGSALVCDQVFERNDRHGQVADVDRHCAPERSLRVDPIGPLQNVDAYGWHPQINHFCRLHVSNRLHHMGGRAERGQCRCSALPKSSGRSTPAAGAPAAVLLGGSGERPIPMVSPSGQRATRSSICRSPPSGCRLGRR